MSDSVYTVPEPGDLPPPINTREEALVWAEENVVATEALRERCNVAYPAHLDKDGQALLVRHQQRAERQWLVKLGGALGVLGTLLRMGQIDPVAYAKLHQRTLATMKPTVVG